MNAVRKFGLQFLLVIAVMGGFAFIANSQLSQSKGTNLGPYVNSPQKDYAPVISADGNTLFFVSSRTGGYGYTDFWISKRVGGSWGPAYNPGPPINTSLPEGTCSITPSATTIYFAICDEPDSPKPKGYGSCDLFWAQMMGDRWSTPANLGPTVNSKAWDSRPSIASDGRTLYFTSERPGGFGDHDIWRTYLTDTGWTAPANLGSAVNTPAADTSPFIHADSVSLYFSSTGRGGFGGLDIFRLTLKNGQWTNILNLKEINTPGDDYFFTIPASGDMGYLAARRHDSIGDFDIYVVPLPYYLRPKKVTTLIGKVYDQDTKKGIKASVELEVFSTGQVYKRDNSNPRTGKYTMIIDPGKKYVFNVSAHCYFDNREHTIMIREEQAGSVIHKDIPMKALRPGATVVLKNIFYDSGKHFLRPESFPELNRVVKLLNEYPGIKVELSGHTDHVGKDAYNQKLSQRRASSAREYIVTQGVNPMKIVAVGYGESRPIASNDTPAGRQLNRRTEFTILEGDECK